MMIFFSRDTTDKSATTKNSKLLVDLLHCDLEEILVLQRFNLGTLTRHSLCQILNASIDQDW